MLKGHGLPEWRKLASKSPENCRFLIIATATGGAMNRHLMGFPSPIMVPHKRNPEEAPSPPSGLLLYLGTVTLIENLQAK